MKAVIKEIMGKDLPLLERLVAVYNLLVIASSSKLRYKCNFLPEKKSLMSIMLWIATPQGHKYWEKIDDAPRKVK